MTAGRTVAAARMSAARVALRQTGERLFLAVPRPIRPSRKRTFVLSADQQPADMLEDFVFATRTKMSVSLFQIRY